MVFMLKKSSRSSSRKLSTSIKEKMDGEYYVINWTEDGYITHVTEGLKCSGYPIRTKTDFLNEVFGIDSITEAFKEEMEKMEDDEEFPKTNVELSELLKKEILDKLSDSYFLIFRKAPLVKLGFFGYPETQSIVNLDNIPSRYYIFRRVLEDHYSNKVHDFLVKNTLREVLDSIPPGLLKKELKRVLYHL